MNFNIFKEEMNKYSKEIEILLNEKQIERFYKYMNILIEENEKVNLTAIVEPKEIILKHFIDSLTINKNIDKNSRVIDVGTGAGFPGIPLKIYRDDIDLILLDSLNKRVNFLNKVINEIDLEKTIATHSRVEDFAKNIENRESFDIATSRAVASLNILIEYLLPLVKVGGRCICMKGSKIDEELKSAKKALEILGGEIEKIENKNLPLSGDQRNIITIKKIRSTPKAYPRKSGMATKKPIV